MRRQCERDPSIELAGWADRDVIGKYWGRALLERAGDQLNYLNMHMMGQRPIRRDTVLNSLVYQSHPDEAWDELIELANRAEKRLVEFEQAVDVPGSKAKIAITENHLTLMPWNLNPILCEWLSAVYHAKTLNLYQRHGAKVAIATAADYAGTRWTVNAVKIPVSLELNKAPCYFTPAGSIMRLFKKHNGQHGVSVKISPQDLDVVASRTDDRIFLHVVNLNYRDSVQTGLSIQGMRVTSGRVFQIAPEDPRTAVTEVTPDVFTPKEAALNGGPAPTWTFPARSVATVELTIAPAPAR
ncbi:MAG TPA: hypothetical protein VKV15_06830 [Bryobacteraceae bacterium]|nr:hypothetical protein [Bryobacteraceae bacterium]